MHRCLHTVCPKSLGQFYIVTYYVKFDIYIIVSYYIKWAKTLLEHNSIKNKKSRLSVGIKC